MTTALLVIDAQRNMLEPDPVYKGDDVLNVIQTLIDRAHAQNAPVIYMQNCGDPGEPDEPGTPGWVIHPDLTPAKNDIVLKKRSPDSFHQTQLTEVLKRYQVNRLVIAGMQTEMCIDTTCRRAAGQGFQVFLAADAHSTFDGTLSAAQIITHHNDVLEAFATVIPAAEIEFL